MIVVSHLLTRFDLICTRLFSSFGLYHRRNLLTLATSATLYWEDIRNLALFVQKQISTLGLPTILIDLLALAFLTV